MLLEIKIRLKHKAISETSNVKVTKWVTLVMDKDTSIIDVSDYIMNHYPNYSLVAFDEMNEVDSKIYAIEFD
jgi:uncharacterized protein YpmB